MISVEVLEFCEKNAISMDNFLKDNVCMYDYVPESGKKRLLKHKDIERWYNVIPVSLLFAFRFSDLVLSKKLLIVEDSLGRYQVYINPCIIEESYELESLRAQLEQINSNFQDYNDVLRSVEVKRQLLEKINEIEENLKLIKHFNGEGSIERTNMMVRLLSSDLRLTRTKNNIDNS